MDIVKQMFKKEMTLIYFQIDLEASAFFKKHQD